MNGVEILTKKKNAVFLAYDQGLEHGPSDFNDENIDPGYVLKIGVEAGFDGIIFQKGIAEKYYTSFLWAGDLPSRVPLIVKLNGKTNFEKEDDPFSPLICTPEEAKRLGAAGVGYTIYIGSQRENEMLEEFGRVVRSAQKEELATIAWMYPRGKKITDPKDPELTAYAARIGLELGADIVKLHYPGSVEALEKVVKAAGKTKVVVSGGPKEEDDAFLQHAQQIKESGAYGMAVGRNIWQHKNPLEISKKLLKIFSE